MQKAFWNFKIKSVLQTFKFSKDSIYPSSGKNSLLYILSYCPASQEWQWGHVLLQSYQGLIIDISLV